MASTIFQNHNNSQIPLQMPARGGNSFMNFVNQFNQFRNNFQGDPEQQVKQLISSGRMTQDQFAQLGQMATEFMKLLPK